MDKTDWKQRVSHAVKKFGAWKFSLLIVAVGLLLMLWPERDTEVSFEPEYDTQADFSVEGLEEKLEGVLSKIVGVGQVSVVLTVETSQDNTYAADRFMGDGEREESLVVISDREGGELPVIETQHAPSFRGALVVCEGGGDPAVRLQICQAVSALTGLGTDRISVCEGN